MSFYLEKNCEVNFPFDEDALADKVVSYCLEYMDFPYEAEVNLTLTDNNGIQEINREFRDFDSPTDVLSFPLLSYETPGDFSFLQEESEDDFNPDTGEVMLGDIVISVDKVREQAKSFGHSEEREFAFLIVHSMLHLFGFDHMTEVEAAQMEEKQNLILSDLNILR
jgi:probable rRNA maturation factor